MADPQDKICFVIGPIGGEDTEQRRHADWLLKGIIRPVFARNDQLKELTVKRADEEQAPGSINSQVINRLWEATLVIADMSFLNANAFYELGIAHMRRRPTIHMIHKEFQIPFDQVPYRAIEFAIDNVDDIDNAQRQLESAAIEAIKDGFQVENPVTHARGYFELAERADEPTRVLASEVASLRGQMDNMQRRLRELRTETFVHGISQDTGALGSVFRIEGTEKKSAAELANILLALKGENETKDE